METREDRKAAAAMPDVDEATVALLRGLAEKYETREFLAADPSRFMHEVEGDENREAAAFIASALSFGARSQFMPRISLVVHDWAHDRVADWIRRGEFAANLARDGERCFYRFFTEGDFRAFLDEYRSLMAEWGSLGGFLRSRAAQSRCGFGGADAVAAICARFGKGSRGVVPRDASSACKRVCMFLRWMVRAPSPVDLGLWKDFIDPASLVMPLDTHVVAESLRLGLMRSKASSFAAARRLSDTLAKAFPGDPLKADFALFGLGVDPSSKAAAKVPRPCRAGAQRALQQPHAS